MSYKDSKNNPLPEEVNKLIDKIRAGNPAAIAPEVYGLRKVLADEPAKTVLGLMELDNATLATYDVEIDGEKVSMLPQEKETYRQWKKRTMWEESFDSKAETAAYTNIGYDWVDWKWLEPGKSPLSKGGPHEKPRYEVLDKVTLKPKTKAEYEQLYAKALKTSPGNSGYCEEGKGKFEIHTFAPHAERLAKDGFKMLKFCNGGDDDILIVDHQRKEFAFFEDTIPLKLAKDSFYKGGNLRSLWQDQDRGID